jgi:hypothetical protein
MKPRHRIKETGGASDQFFNHGPLELIYGSESRLSDVSFHLSLARKRRIDHIAFFGCRFETVNDVEGEGAPTAAAPFFRVLGRKLRRVSVSGGLSICGMPNVGDDEVESLAPFFDEGTSCSSGRGASSLRSLDLTGSRITANGIRGGPLGRFFRRSSSLEALAMGENPGLGDEGATAVAEALTCGGGRLRHLSLEGCGIGRRGTFSISELVRHPVGSLLRVLELGRNDVGDDGAKLLADALVGGGKGGQVGCRHHMLVRLGLAEGGIGDVGALHLAAALMSNRSLIALSLRDNPRITDVGAAGLLGVIYDDASIYRIVQCNHILKSLDLRGCSGMSSRLLQKAIHISAIDKSPCTEAKIVQLKVSAHLKNSHCGIILEDYDLELMPYILAFIGKTSGMTSLFNTLQNMPNLYSKNDPPKCLAKDERIIEDPSNKKKKKNTTFLDQLKLSSRKTRRLYTTFVDRIPRRCSVPHHHNCRVRNGYKSALDDSLRNNNSPCNISLDSFYSTALSFNCMHRTQPNRILILPARPLRYAMV